MLKTIRNTVKIAFGITYYKQQKTFSKDSCIAYFLNSKKKKRKKKRKELKSNFTTKKMFNLPFIPCTSAWSNQWLGTEQILERWNYGKGISINFKLSRE